MPQAIFMDKKVVFTQATFGYHIKLRKKTESEHNGAEFES